MKTFLRGFLLFTFIIGFGCIAVATPTLFVAVAVAQVVCGGASTGSINITPGGGTGPYTYIWSNGSTTQSLNNLGAGTYTVTITDAIGDHDTAAITVTAPPSFSVSKTITNEPCGGYNVGAVQINVSGGTPGYSYQWSNGDTSQNIAGLSAAVYYVTISDAHGCSTIDSANVTQPPGVVISDSITDASCSNPNGAINITVQYGNPGYTYLWSDSSIGLNRTGLNQGNYIITVTDTLGCTASASEVVGEAPSGMSANYQTTQPSCYSGSDGKIWMTSVVGSIGPFTFSWNDGDTSRSRTNLPAGTYIITAISGVGCTVTDTIILGQPTAMNISLTEIPFTCFGSNNGAINTIVTNGANPYTYDWSGGVTNQNRIGLITGNYTVTVTDHNGCTLTATTTVTEPALVTANLVPTSVSCIGGNTGSITTTAVGGTGPYSYWWGAGVNTQNRTNLNAGIYTITVTDAHGCTGTATTTVPAYTPMTVTTAQTNSICFGVNSGSLALIVSNGKGPYNYLWSNGDTTQNADSLAGGIFDVTITDNSNCTVSKSYTLTQPPFPITIDATVNDVSCNGDNNGSISINPVNGASPYAYNWGGGITTQNRTNLAPGTYNPTITDNNGCTASTSLTVTQPTPISITFTDTNVACFGGNNAAIGLNVTGSYPPYSFKWSTGGSQQNLQLLSAGNYAVTVTDNHGCTGISNTTLTQPTNATLTTTVTNATCNGGNNGVINLNVTGGTPGYTYNWGGGVISQNLSNALAGNYSVTVTDNASCTYTTTAIIAEPTAIGIIATVTNIICNSGNVGAINLNVSGGGTSYTFNWGGGITAQNRSNLAMGTYVVTVTDNNGCTVTSSSTITQSTSLSVTSTVTNVICNGAANGTIDITPTSGTGPYSYNWGGGVISQNRSNLAPGNYTVNITDNNGCTATNTFAITQPNAISATAAAVNVSCNSGNNGSINLTITGGTSPYTFNWGGGVTTQNRTNLIAGNYAVIITDSAGCTTSANTAVGQPTAVSTTTAITNITCNGGNNGAITLNTTGGTGLYTYNWGGGISTPDRTNLTSGNYTVTTTDANSCTATASAAITEPTAISISLTATNASCAGQATGDISSNVTGGKSGYNYLWNNNSTLHNLTNIVAGAYSLTITDANACTASNGTNVGQPTPVATVLTATNATCNGTPTGDITSSTNGGTGSYTYNWSNSATSQNLINVITGVYSITVKDANQCSATASANISQPATISVNATISNVSCNGGNNGSITTAVSGGSGGYNYNWSNIATTGNINNLAAGSYAVTVKDASNCSALYSATITQPASITIIANAWNAGCNGGNNGSITLNVSGGVSPYSFDWGGGITSQNINNLAAGNYSVTVTDSNLCIAIANATVNQPTGLTVSAPSENATCFGQSTGGISAMASGGSGSYTFIWSNDSTGQNVTNIMAGNYSVTVTDANSCTATTSGTVSQPPQIVSTGFVTNATCNGTANGGVVLTVNGGAGGFSYNWSNNSTGQNLQTVDAGNYSVIITDANLCTATNSFTVTQPSSIVITTSSTNVSCFGGNNGGVNTIVTGGSGNYSYIWNTTSTSPGIAGLVAGSYTVTVKDAANCSTTVSANVIQPLNLTSSVNPINVSCNGGNNGSAALTVTGGTLPYSYEWSNNGSTQQVNNLTPNTYTVTITDSHLCTSTATTTITQPAPITITESHSDYACAAKGGTLSLTTTGGVGPYSYNWGNGIIAPNRTNLNPGIYTVTLTDANGCTATSSVAINQLPAMNATLTTKDVTCYNQKNGSIATVVTGGTLPYNFLWNTGAITQNIDKLSAAFYEVQITDSNSCIITATTTVTQPDLIVVSPSIVPPSCSNESNGSITAIVTGGIPGYNYVWGNQNTSPGISNIPAGTYSLTVTDSAGCSAIENSIIVTQPLPISASASATAAGCTTNNGGSVDLTLSGGSPSYSFNWSNSDNTQNISGLAAGRYSVIITDVKNCTASATATVIASPPVVIASTVQNASCAGVDNGSIDLSITGGTPSFSYLWNDGAGTANLANVAPGNYAVTVTDASGCSAVSNFAVSTEYTLTVNATGSTTINEGHSTSINAVTNVDHNNIYTWSPSELVTCSTCATTQVGPVQTTEFTISVVDTNGCKATDNVIINVNTDINIFIPNVFSPNADGNNDYFQIFGDFGSIVYLNVMVFDRWGEKVYESEEPQFKWDGTYRGQPAPIGVYVYTMSVAFADGGHRDYKGSVTLVK